MTMRTMNVSVLNVVRGLLNVWTALRAASRDLRSSSDFTDGLRFLITGINLLPRRGRRDLEHGAPVPNPARHARRGRIDPRTSGDSTSYASVEHRYALRQDCRQCGTAISLRRAHGQEPHPRLFLPPGPSGFVPSSSDCLLFLDRGHQSRKGFPFCWSQVVTVGFRIGCQHVDCLRSCERIIRETASGCSEPVQGLSWHQRIRQYRNPQHNWFAWIGR